jgi:hypothetical protein
MPANEPTALAVMIFMKVRRSVFDMKYAPIVILQLPPLNEDRPTGHARIREADAADAKSSPSPSSTCGRCISDGESR